LIGCFAEDSKKTITEKKRKKGKKEKEKILIL